MLVQAGSLIICGHFISLHNFSGGFTKSGHPLIILPDVYKWYEVLETELHLLLKYYCHIIPRAEQVINVSAVYGQRRVTCQAQAARLLSESRLRQGCCLTCHLRLRLSKSESKVLASYHETLRTLHD